MHEHIKALLALDDINRQRLILARQRQDRESAIAAAREQAAKAAKLAEEAERKAGGMDALIRQYTSDVERCDQTVVELRGKQMMAKSNKDYLAIINGIEEAKHEKKQRVASLANVGGEVDKLREHADALAATAAAAASAVDALIAEQADRSEAGEAEAELDRLYAEAKAKVDAKYLEVYERLIQANHPRPLMQVDGSTRATPMGNMISTQKLEALRLGQLVTDPSSNAILYVDE